ncbi:MAG: putative Caspase, p20 [Deltaproteobacteria bacterium]|nr:putative Caspase, p20 [Deltaproteobacteria bacterium]
MKKKALLVGINKYPDPRDELKGCVNDVRLMQETLGGEYGFTEKGSIRVLTDSGATTNAILDGLSWLADGAAPGDSLVFHYSGHGSQAPDRHGDETADGLDEILCPYDLDWDRPLTDDDLAAACAGIPKGALLTVILDCCHSGTGLREPARPPRRSYAPPRPRFLPFPEAFPLTARRPARRFGVSVTKTNAVLLAACRDDQTSADALIGAAYHGAHTFHLWRSLRDAGWLPTYLALVASMGAAIAKDGFDQVPQLEGPVRLLSSGFLEPPPGTRPPGNTAIWAQPPVSR